MRRRLPRIERPAARGAAALLPLVLAFIAAAGSASAGGQTNDSHGGLRPTIMLESMDGLEVQAVHEKGLDPVKVTADVGTYRGRRALHLLNDDRAIGKGNPSGGQSLAIVKGSDFKDGTIQVDVVGWPREGSPPDTRGFVGIAFRVQDHGGRFEAFYLRFTNGRADDQFRRNHSAQIRIRTGLPLVSSAPGESGGVRIVRRYRAGSVDDAEIGRRRHEGAALCEQCGSTLPDRKRS